MSRFRGFCDGAIVSTLACIGIVLAVGGSLLAREGANRSFKLALGNVFDQQWSFDGDRLLHVRGKIVYMHNVATGKPLQQFVGHAEQVHAVTFSPDGKQVLTGGGRVVAMTGLSTDNSARLWDVTSGKELMRFEGHKAYIHTVEFSPDGKRILTAGRDSTARLWDSDTGQQLFVFRGITYLPPAATMNSDGRSILGLTEDSVTVWDAVSGKTVCRLEVPGNGVNFKSAQFSPNGKLIVTASADNTVRTWNAKTGRPLRVFKGHTSYVHRALFTPNGEQILTASSDGTTKLWNANTAEEIRQFQHPGAVREIILSGDGKRFFAKWRLDANFTVKNGISLWNAEFGNEILQVADGELGHIVGFTPDGTKFLVMKSLNEFVLHSAETGKPLPQLTAAR
ncbi:MAG: WD40 repeat domain-containing protein [Pirellulales bacterium]